MILCIAQSRKQGRHPASHSGLASLIRRIADSYVPVAFSCLGKGKPVGNILAALAVCGCSPSSSGRDFSERAEKAYALEHPIGRYQIVPLVRSDIVQAFVLDTRTGTVRLCSEAKTPLAVGCGSPSNEP